MSILFGEDTSPEAEAILIQGYRRMSPAQKLHRVEDLTRTVQLMALARIRTQHPNATEREVKLRLASLWLDAETMRTIFGWDPSVQGY
jgi:Ser/Thr protein kinase RdoA (MazF antagonist)